jgi:hypothetical protein
MLCNFKCLQQGTGLSSSCALGEGYGALSACVQVVPNNSMCNGDA